MQISTSSPDVTLAGRILADFLDDKEHVTRAGQATRYLYKTQFSHDLLFEELEHVLLAAVEEG